MRDGVVSWQRLEDDKMVHDRLVCSYAFAGEYIRLRTESSTTRVIWLVAIMSDLPMEYVGCKG